MTETLSSLNSSDGLAAKIGRLSYVIHSHGVSAGERAALRRWVPNQPIPIDFYRIWLFHIEDELPKESQTLSWMVLAWGIATCGEGCHDPQRPLGQALAESRFPEPRLERLLSAPSDVRVELFMGAIRFLAAKRESFNWVTAAEYLLTEDEEKRERLNRRVAKDFYRHLPSKSKE